MAPENDRVRRVFYWLPDEITGAPDRITIALWDALQSVAHNHDLALTSFSTGRELRRLVRAHGKPALVHFGTTPMIKWTPRARAVATALALRVPLSTHVHGDVAAELRFLWTHRWRHALKVAASYTLSPHLLRCFDLVVVNSRALALRLHEGLALTGRIQVLPNPVDVAFWSEPGPSPPRQPYVFSHGRIVPEKGFDLLIEAIARAGSSIHLVIAGTGSAQAKLEQLAARRGVAVDFVGQQSPERIRELLRGATIAVYPSRQDAFSLAALEALLACKHVLVSEVAGVLDFLPPLLADAIRVTPSVDTLAARLADPPIISIDDAGAARFAPESVAHTLATAIVETLARR
jgi:glycosyltransferase involved in cell wall biosynthesis